MQTHRYRDTKRETKREIWRNKCRKGWRQRRRDRRTRDARCRSLGGREAPSSEGPGLRWCGTS